MNRPPAPAAAAFDRVRRGDLDALRSLAMLLGLALHASLAYFPFPWPVQDPQQQPSLALLYALVHGFRMPLFFLLSGFFTMLVLERHGLKQLLEQRALRILLPLVIATATILPLDKAAIAWGIRRSVAATAARSPLAGGILTGDAASVRRGLAAEPDLSARDPRSGLTPLAMAAMAGDPALVAAVLDAGAAVDGQSKDGGTPLHAATFMGHVDVVALLLARGANPAATNTSGKTPLATLATPPGVAVLVGEFLGLPRLTAAAVEEGRRRIRARLGPLTPATKPKPLESLAEGYRAALASPRLGIDMAGRSWQLFETDVFDHLWFLWYLCWLVAGFATLVAFGLPPTGRHRWWLLPASCLPYALMWSPFGPDTALGLLPTPHLFLFYGCFFWFGAATFAAEGAGTTLGARWPIVLPMSLVVLLPAGVATLHDKALAMVLQPAFAWGMAIGLIGLFQRCFRREHPAVRWLADASYWMYLIHVPLVIVGQGLLCDLPWPASAKFLVVLTAVVAVTLIIYRLFVRYTPIGWLLNGPRRTAGCR